jgi:hypothetical protein
MLNESSTSAVLAAPTNVGLTAFQVAVVQAKVFKKTLAEVSDRADDTAKVLERKAEEQRQTVRERLAQQRGGVDIVVDGSGPAKEKSTQDANVPSPGGEVDIKA